MTTTKVAVVGPNLLSRDGFGFHVHAAGCADRRRPIYRHHQSDWNHPWTVQSFAEVVEGVYADIMAENDDTDWHRYGDDFKVFPCLKALPTETPQEA